MLFVILRVPLVALHNVPSRHQHRSVDSQRMPNVISQKTVPVTHQLALQIISRPTVSIDPCSLDDEFFLQITNKGQSCGSGLNCASGQCTSLSRTCSDRIRSIYFDCWNGSPMSINWWFHGIKHFMSKSRGHILSGVMPGSHKG